MTMTNTTESPYGSQAQAQHLRVVRVRTAYERWWKRSLDLVLASALVLVMLPVILLIAFAIRVGLGKGVLYSQQRVGRDGQPFTIWKFRTMRPDRRTRSDVPVEQDRRQQHKTVADPRHTGLGRLLRRLSLDELPQLLNVLRGDMSLVGPRPEVLSIAEERGYLDHVRHQVRPGMTGPYQVSDLRYNGDLRDGLDVDADYVQRVSLRSDLRYLFRTVAVMLGRSSSGS